jgi:hypothetical protein
LDASRTTRTLTTTAPTSNLRATRPARIVPGKEAVERAVVVVLKAGVARRLQLPLCLGFGRLLAGLQSYLVRQYVRFHKSIATDNSLLHWRGPSRWCAMGGRPVMGGRLRCGGLRGSCFLLCKRGVEPPTVKSEPRAIVRTSRNVNILDINRHVVKRKRPSRKKNNLRGTLYAFFLAPLALGYVVRESSVKRQLSSHERGPVRSRC